MRTTRGLASRTTVRAALRRKCGSFLALPWSDRGLVVEAVITLAIARLTLILLPFEWYVRWLRLGGATPAIDLALAVRVGRAVRLGARNVPWSAVCLPQAMTAKAMLARRGCGSALVVSVGPSADQAMNLHAWLEVNGTVITGGSRSAAATPIARFG